MIYTRPESPPPDGAELITRRYNSVLSRLSGQDETLHAAFDVFEGWAVALQDLQAENAALRERVSTLEAIVRDWSQPLPAETLIEQAQETADSAARDTGTLTDVLVLALRRLGIAVDPDSTVDEVKEFLEGGSE